MIVPSVTVAAIPKEALASVTTVAIPGCVVIEIVGEIPNATVLEFKGPLSALPVDLAVPIRTILAVDPLLITDDEV